MTRPSLRRGDTGRSAPRLLLEPHPIDLHARGRPPCTCRRPSTPPRSRRSGPPSRHPCARAPSPCASIRTVRSSTGSSDSSTASRPSGWQSGINSPVRFAARMPASRATSKTSPFVARRSTIMARVAGSIRTSPLARAGRRVSVLGRDVHHPARAVIVEMRQSRHARVPSPAPPDPIAAFNYSEQIVGSPRGVQFVLNVFYELSPR